MTLTSLAIGLLPVVLFLGALVLMDSYKLVHWRALVTAILVGGIAAAICFEVNRLLLVAFHLPVVLLTHFVAPAIEETAKAFYVVWLVRVHRVGFLVDAAIMGFAIGTGFALVENLYYAGTLGDAGPWLWIARGLGTAIMHAATTGVVGVLTKNAVDRQDRVTWTQPLPGLLIAIAAHGVFNHIARQPLLATGFVLLVLPLVMIVVFERSERATRDWLGTGLDLDIELLEVVMSEGVSDTRVGRYLHTLQERFDGPVVADMLCLLRIHLELSVRAKGVLIARAAGVEVPIDDSVRANLREMSHLEQTIGVTGRMAMQPILSASGRDLWQLQLLARR
jgi:RsiW-degrading membrane proteinase PrsW (M82 family)